SVRSLPTDARVLLCFALAACSARTVNAQDDQIKALIEKYAKSIDGANTTLGAEVWSTGTDVSLIHPMGHERGWQQIKSNFYENAMGKMFTKRELKPKDIAT